MKPTTIPTQYNEMIRVQNADAYERTIPGFGVVAILTSDDDDIAAGIVPVGGSTTGGEDLLINGPSPIVFGGYGAAFAPTFPTAVLTRIDAAYVASTVAVGEDFGPVATEAEEDIDADIDFKAIRGQPGLWCLAGIESDDVVEDTDGIIRAVGRPVPSLLYGVVTRRPRYNDNPPVITVKMLAFSSLISPTMASEETEVYWLDAPKSGGYYIPAARALIDCGMVIAIAKSRGRLVLADAPFRTIRKGWSEAGSVTVDVEECPSWASDSEPSGQSDSSDSDYEPEVTASWPFATGSVSGPVWCSWTGEAWMVTAATCDWESSDSDDPTESEWLL